MQKQMYEKAKSRLMLIGATSLLAAGCAPTFESHIDSPPASISAPIPADQPMSIALAALDPRPQLPDAAQAPCPPGSGLAACFTFDQDIVRQKRFKILHDDRDYCRDAYERARGRASE
jgi:hypothetical protein